MVGVPKTCYRRVIPAQHSSNGFTMYGAQDETVPSTCILATISNKYGPNGYQWKRQGVTVPCEGTEKFATIMSLENGKTISEATGEVVYAASFISCETPYTCLALTKLAIEAGLPPAVVQVCPTRDRKAASEVATNPLVRKISFTGSTQVGKMLAELAARTLKRVSLELGGNAPVIVFDDADLETAVDGVMFSKFRCSGQTCVCANRIYVQSGIAKAFTEKLVTKVKELKMGPGLDTSTTQGPLINRSAVDKVNEHIADAVSKGAKIEFGGKQEKTTEGFYSPPTVLSGVTADMIVSRDETFGPLAPIFEFKTEEEALRLANDTEFGLAGYFFTKDINRVQRVSQKLQVGMVGVNTGKISAAEAPFGGVKESGYGREGSLYGLEEYQTIKSVTIGNQNVW
ncbi:hypothetical protein B7463_g3133, partial [Scytalidium lignicola]